MNALIRMSVICASLAMSVVAEARTIEEIKASGKLIVATETAYPPFTYTQNGKRTGLDVELMEAVAQKMGVKVEWKVLSFDVLLVGLAQNRWDMAVSSIGITPTRAKAVTFANPEYCSGAVIVSKDPQVNSIATLNNKIIAVQTGTTYLPNLRAIPNVKEIKNYPKDADAISALLAGRVDAWVSDRFSAKAAITSMPQAGLRIGGYVLVEKLAAAVKKDNVNLANAYNKALAAVMTDGTYQKISEKYTGEDVRCK